MDKLQSFFVGNTNSIVRLDTVDSDNSLEDDVRLDEAREQARAEHVRRIDTLKKQAESSRLLAERLDLQKLIKIRNSLKECRERYLLRSAGLDFQSKMTQRESKLIEAIHQLNIETFTKLEVSRIRTTSRIDSIRKEAEANALSSSVRIVGAALVEYNNAELLSETRGTNLVSRALNKLYQALVLDTVAKCIFNMISDKLNIDQEFKFKLEWPLGNNFRRHTAGTKRQRSSTKGCALKSIAGH